MWEFPLHTINLFANVNAKTLEVGGALVRDRRYRRREILFLPHEPCDRLYLIGGGHVKLYKLSPEGKVITLWVLGPKECFGELAFMDGISTDCYAEVISDAWLGIIPAREFLALMKSDLSLRRSVTNLIAARRRDIEERAADCVFKSIAGRLATLLLKLADKHGNAPPQGIFNSVKLRHEDIANLIGTARATTTRILNNFKRAGVLDFDRQKMLILNRPYLEQIATESATATQQRLAPSPIFPNQSSLSSRSEVYQGNR